MSCLHLRLAGSNYPGMVYCGQGLLSSACIPVFPLCRALAPLTITSMASAPPGHGGPKGLGSWDVSPEKP